VELEAVFQHHLVEDVGFVEQGVGGDAVGVSDSLGVGCQVLGRQTQFVESNLLIRGIIKGIALLPFKQSDD
jgi:hypothetical protein